MSSSANIVEVAALIGDTARATMLAALMEGQQLTGSELAAIAHVSRSTASEHLKKLVDARLVCVSPQGRHCYYRIGSPLVARMLESIGAVAAIDVPPRFRPRSLRNEALVLVRTCYDHLAGTLAVALAEKLESGGHIVLGEDGGEVTPGGLAHFEQFGLALPRTRTGRYFCRPCLDWTERRHHLAGAVGVALACRCFELGWLRRQPASRVVAGHASRHCWAAALVRSRYLSAGAGEDYRNRVKRQRSSTTLRRGVAIAAGLRGSTGSDIKRLVSAAETGRPKR